MPLWNIYFTHLKLMWIGTKRAMTQSPSPPESRRRPWYWPFDKLKYNQIQTREDHTEEYELGGLVDWAHRKG